MKSKSKWHWASAPRLICHIRPVKFAAISRNALASGSLLWLRLRRAMRSRVGQTGRFFGGTPVATAGTLPGMGLEMGLVAAAGLRSPNKDLRDLGTPDMNSPG